METCQTPVSQQGKDQLEEPETGEDKQERLLLPDEFHLKDEHTNKRSQDSEVVAHGIQP